MRASLVYVCVCVCVCVCVECARNVARWIFMCMPDWSTCVRVCACVWFLAR